MFADFVLDLDIGSFRCLGFQLDGISIFLLSSLLDRSFLGSTTSLMGYLNEESSLFW